MFKSQAISSSAVRIKQSELMKAVKNPVEVANIRRAHIKDGVAVTRFMYWLKTRVKAAGTEDGCAPEGQPAAGRMLTDEGRAVPS